MRIALTLWRDHSVGSMTKQYTATGETYDDTFQRRIPRVGPSSTTSRQPERNALSPLNAKGVYSYI